jgi:3-oxoacyl-[acyl-carrier-protein] synthase II
MDNSRTTDGALKIVITGLGLVTPLGIGKDEFSRRIFAGDNAIAEIQSFDTADFGSHLGAEVTAFQPRDFISVKNIRRMDRLSLITSAAARLALEDAGLTVNPGNRDRIGILLGTSFGATDVTVQFAGTLLTAGAAFVNPILVPNTVMNAPAGHASIELGFRGVNTTVTHFAVSAETAISYAVSEIRRGAADYMLAGGVDILSRFYYETLCRFKTLSPLDGGKEMLRPFDKARNGTVAGEGCGLICIESWESAQARGRKPYCEIKGSGLGSSPTKPAGWPQNAEGIKKTIRRALAAASVGAEDISAISAAANGGLTLDRMEAEAYAEVFSSGRRPVITSLKGAVGESFSGGGMRACALALSMEKGAVPQTVGLVNPDLPLSFVVGEEKKIDINNALLAGVSFGGTYAYLVFGSYSNLGGF